jgi:Protein of unknown function (DUF1460)
MMRRLITIVGLGSGLLLTAAVHLQAIAQNQGGKAPSIAKPQLQPAKPATKPVAISPADPLSPADRQEFNDILKQVESGTIPRQELGPMIQAIAEKFRGYGYTADLLDRQEPETLQLSLKRFDCVLFVEAMLGLTRTMRSDDPAAGQFVAQMQAQRYRDGQVDGYCSRLHYFSDWILENQRQGRVQDLGEELDGVPLNRSLNFMSQNWQKYPQLVANPANRACIQSMEQHLGTVNLRYIPTDRINGIKAQLQSGDIIAVVTRTPGLDVTHTGLVYRNGNGDVGMIHAAPRVGVIVSSDLQRYVGRLGPSAIGILVARPLTP